MVRTAAWVVAIVAVLSMLVGAFMSTTLDPIIQALFNNPNWSSNTAAGTDTLLWMEQLWAFLPAAVLLGILTTVWIATRQPT